MGTCEGIRWDFSVLIINPRSEVRRQVYWSAASVSSREGPTTSQSSRYINIMMPRLRSAAPIVFAMRVNTRGAVESPNGSTTNSYRVSLYRKRRNLWCSGLTGTCRYASFRSILAAHAGGTMELSIVLSVSIRKRFGRMNLLRGFKFKIGRHTPASFLGVKKKVDMKPV